MLRSGIAAVGPRAFVLLACCAAAAPSAEALDTQAFDLQAHRGGLGLTTENTVEGFARALEVGVTTLELDVRLTEDGMPVVTHDRRVSAEKCRDTSPAAAGDADFPYVGDLVRSLSFAQISTLDCGWQQLPGFPHQRVAAGARMPLLSEVFALLDCYGADEVRLSIDPKFAADAPHETAPRGELAEVVAREVRRAGMLDRVTIHGLDWRVLTLVRQLEPRLPIVAAWTRRSLQVSERGPSPWLGGIDIDDFGGSVVAAVASFDADGVAPSADDLRDASGLDWETVRKHVGRAHRAGMTVLPWTVNDATTMRRLIDADVDGVITDYPDRLRTAMTQRGLTLPPAHGSREAPAPSGGGQALEGLLATWLAPLPAEPACLVEPSAPVRGCGYGGGAASVFCA